jgi:hypothetical protein
MKPSAQVHFETVARGEAASILNEAPKSKLAASTLASVETYQRH